MKEALPAPRGVVSSKARKESLIALASSYSDSGSLNLKGP
jgi:hypothetical protein